MAALRPIYHSLATGRHINEVVIGMLLIALIFDGYAIIAGALAFCNWLKRSARKAEKNLSAPRVKAVEMPATQPPEIHASRVEVLQS